MIINLNLFFLFSHLHSNISIRFLTCEPNLQGIPNYLDESDKFFAHPAQWLHATYLQKDASHLVKGPRRMGQFYIDDWSPTDDHNKLYKKSGNDKSRFDSLKRRYPSHIVAFDSLDYSISQFIDIAQYLLCKKIFNAHFQDGKKGKYINIYCKKGQ